MLGPVTKSPLQSVTILSGLGAFIVQLLAIFGIEVTVDTVNDIVLNLSSIVTAVLALVSIYGRWQATHTIRSSG